MKKPFKNLRIYTTHELAKVYPSTLCMARSTVNSWDRSFKHAYHITTHVFSRQSRIFSNFSNLSHFLSFCMSNLKGRPARLYLKGLCKDILLYRFWFFNFDIKFLKGDQSSKVLTAQIYLIINGLKGRQDFSSPIQSS